MLGRLRREAIDRSLRLARSPLRLLGPRGERLGNEIDARVRDVAGRLVFDDELRADAARQRAAARERKRAEELDETAAAVREEGRAAAERRKSHAKRVERDAKERIDAVAREERLEALDKRHEAVVDEAEAAAAREEARRLKHAADDAKARRG